MENEKRAVNNDHYKTGREGAKGGLTVKLSLSLIAREFWEFWGYWGFGNKELQIPPNPPKPKRDLDNFGDESKKSH